MPLFYQKPMKPPAFKDEPVAPYPHWLQPDYLPHLEQAKSYAGIGWISEQEYNTDSQTLVFDIEVYPNYFMVGFANVDTGNLIFVETYDRLSSEQVSFIHKTLRKHKCVGFNSIKYDMPMLAIALSGYSTSEIFSASKGLIVDDLPVSEILSQYKSVLPKCRHHIDLREVAPLHGSLKVYSGRLHCDRIQDLPFPPETCLTADQIACVRYYNLASDLPATRELYNALTPQIELREKMSKTIGVELCSKSDAQIAEAVIRHELKKLGIEAKVPVIEPGTGYRYKPPTWMRFQTEAMQYVFDTVLASDFIVGESGSIRMPDTLSELKVEIGSGVYRMGIGGLHSSETSIINRTDEEGFLVDKDVTSYYPFIILNNDLYPEHLGPQFLTVFRDIVERRVKAKKAGDNVTANSLKIVINGTFGKLGSKYSIIYSPNLLIQVTITGQLSLLMLIEHLEKNGIRVASANTDGIVIKCPHHLKEYLEQCVAWWEATTGFTMESTFYNAVYSRDVNNYIAVKTDGKVKLKGAYANPWGDQGNRAGWLQKNPTGIICIEAVQAYITEGKPVDVTIRNCQDIDKFVFVRTVKGGGVKVGDRIPPPHNSKEELVRQLGYTPHWHKWRSPDDALGVNTVTLDYAYELAKHKLSAIMQSAYVGKTVRWYYATGTDGCIVYAENGNKVPKTDGAKPCLDLPAVFPADVDYQWYIDEAKSILNDIGVLCE